MVLVRLKGSPQTQWNIDGHYKPGSSPIHLTEEQVVKHKQVIEEVVDVEFKHLVEKELVEIVKVDVKEEPKVQPKLLKKYSSEELFALTKDEQIQLLISLGVKDAKKLKTEELRVNAILVGQQ
jgi:hypothetical protein